MGPTPPKTRPASYDDLVGLPDGVVGEIVDGELIVSRRPSPRHAMATSYLNGELSGRFGRGRGGPGGWLLLFEPELHLDRDVLVPDLAGWLLERMPQPPEAPWFTVRPDWVCEVLSPSTVIVDRTRKQEIYRREGVPWLWFVDPGARLIEVLRLAGAEWVVAGAFGGEGEMRIPPFDAVAIDVGALWGSPPASG